MIFRRGSGHGRSGGAVEPGQAAAPRLGGELLIDVKDLHVVFPGRDATLHALTGVDLEVGAGEAVGLVGESGCGKSTLARALLGIVPRPGRITQGRVRVCGVDVTSARPAELRALRGGMVAMVFQDPMSALNPVMTVGDQILEALALHTPLRGRRARARALELLELVGIPDPEGRLGAYPHQLSGGMRQRVVIAMAVSCDPAVLVADEPTTALDVTVQAQVLEVLQRLKAELGMAIVLVSHDLGVVARLADRINVLYGGQIVEAGGAAQVLSGAQHPYTQGLLGSRADIDAPRPPRLASVQGAAPRLTGPPLECPFRPRCLEATAVCTASNPTLLPVHERHAVACHHRAPLKLGDRTERAS